MAQDSYADLVGRTVSLNDTKGPLKPCLYCGGRHAEITAGTATHAAGLRCTACGRHIGWLGKRHLDAIRAAMGLPHVAVDDDFGVIEGAE